MDEITCLTDMLIRLLTCTLDIVLIFPFRVFQLKSGRMSLSDLGLDRVGH